MESVVIWFNRCLHFQSASFCVNIVVGFSLHPPLHIIKKTVHVVLIQIRRFVRCKDKSYNYRTDYLGFTSITVFRLACMGEWHLVKVEHKWPINAGIADVEHEYTFQSYCKLTQRKRLMFYFAKDVINWTAFTTRWFHQAEVIASHQFPLPKMALIRQTTIHDISCIMIAWCIFINLVNFQIFMSFRTGF